jgi:hypothetical protein
MKNYWEGFFAAAARAQLRCGMSAHDAFQASSIMVKISMVRVVAALVRADGTPMRFGFAIGENLADFDLPDLP